MAVDDYTKFHNENLVKNKDHYTMFSRFTKGKVLNFVQKNGARIHLNDVKIPTDNYKNLLEDEEFEFEENQKEVHFRYCIVNTSDLVRDLKYWETLMVSSMMQRPMKTLINCDPELGIMDVHQTRNLKSAVAFAALNTKDGFEQRDFY
jgi:hypothetical protein